MDSPAASSAVTRYRPAVLIATGLAAAYGTYLVFRGLTYTETPSPPASTGLHRSNAVHRPNRHRRLSYTTFISYDPRERLWPDCVCSVNDRKCFSAMIINNSDAMTGQYSFNLATGGPVRANVLSALRLSPQETDTAIHEMQLAALDHIFHVIVNAPLDSEVGHSMPDIRDALDAGDATVLLTLEEVFTIGRWTFDLHTFQAAVAAWCTRDPEEPAAMIRSGVMNRRTVDDDAETLADDSDPDEDGDPGQGLKGLLYHIAEEEAKRSAYIHRGTRCDSCNQLPITGVRWHCLNCPDFDLCSTCEALGQHPRTHVFAKVQIPISPRAQPREMHPLWYPGNPDSTVPGRLSQVHRKELSDQSGFDEPRIDALHDQFFCLSSPFRDNEVYQNNLGIDRFTFHKIFAGDSARHPIAPNYLYDRLFDFYDEDRNGQITFPEFVKGLAYLQMPAKRRSLDKVFQGYDADGDGYISRADMVCMLRAKYVIHKEMTMDIVAIEDAQTQPYGRNLTRELRSNRPISSLFADAEIPYGESRQPMNKPVDEFGDRQVLPDPLFGQAILPNGQSDIDVSFWKAIFEKHGRPNSFADLHPQFNDRLDARLQVRDRYISTESFELNASDRMNERYLLVPADSRHRRPIFSTRQSLAKEWGQDIADVNSKLANGHINGVGATSSLDGALERDQTIVVTPEERDLGDEVLYQVIEDAINEILDALFAEREELAQRVQDTMKYRQRFQKEIAEFIEQRDSYRVEEHVHDNVLKPAKLDADENGLFVKDDRQAQDSNVEDDRNIRSASPSPEEQENRTRPGDQSNGHADATSDGETTRPELNQNDLIDHLRATAVPTDESSLTNMEESIRHQNLDTLLEAAGYSVADTEPSEPTNAEDTARDAETDGPAEGEQRQDTTISLAAFRGSQGASGFSDGPSIAPTSQPTNRFVVPDTSEVASDDELSVPADDREPVQELPWTPESVRNRRALRDEFDGELGGAENRIDGLTEDIDDVKDEQADEHIVHPQWTAARLPLVDSDGPSTPVKESADTTAATSPADEDVPPTGDAESGQTNGATKKTSPSNRDSTTNEPDSHRDEKSSSTAETSRSPSPDPNYRPSAAQLEEWALLDEAEVLIRRRGGPARLNLAEFEEAVWRDENREEWKRGLKGVVEGWLEWAFF